MYPGFPVPKVEPLAIWDTSEPVDDILFDGEDDLDDDADESEDE